MAQDVVDSAFFAGSENNIKESSIRTLNSEMPNKEQLKERRKRVFKTILNRIRCKKHASAAISKPDPTYRVVYLGNVVTGWAKGDGCVEKPLATLWRNYTQSSRPDVRMQLTVSPGGLKATTRDHGLTEYWAHRLTTCAAPSQFPRLFCWVYRHEGRRLRHELRCHAVLCSTAAVARQIEAELKQSLYLALQEFKRDKISRQNARLSLANSLYENPTIPRRKILLSTGSHNYKPPLERSKSAPKLTSIEEIVEEEDEVFRSSRKMYKEILKCYDTTNNVLTNKSFILNSLQRGNTVGSKSKREEHEPGSGDGNFDNTLTGLSLDEKSDMILEELVQNSLRNDLLESCERAWFTALRQKPDLIPLRSEETSLSSGCDSTETIVSDSAFLPTMDEILYEVQDETSETVVPEQTDPELKRGESHLMSHVKTFEKISNSDLLKYCGLSSVYNNKSILEQEEVSLIPVGENHSDFSSLKVYKKRSMSEPACIMNTSNGNNSDEEEIGSACSDESGYDEDELASFVGNVVLV